MTTKNHKSANTSDIVPATLSSDPSSGTLLAKEEVLLTKEDPHSIPPSPSTPDPRHSFSITRARCGKVARLPKEIRDHLNEMLLDGVPHAKIIQALRDKFGPPATSETNVLPLDTANAGALTLAPSDGERAGVRGPSATPQPAEPETCNTNHEPNQATPNTENVSDSPSTLDTRHADLLLSLTPLNITNWKKFGGYRDWLRDQQRIADCKLRHELTLDLARNAEGLASYQAAPKVAVAQICQTIIDLGPEGIKDAMKDSPLNCFRLLNALARLVNSGLKCEQVVAKQAPAREKLAGFTAPVIEKMEKALNMM